MVKLLQLCIIILYIISVAAADEHRLSMDGQSKQYITINIISLNKVYPSFG